MRLTSIGHAHRTGQQELPADARVQHSRLSWLDSAHPRAHSAQDVAVDKGPATALATLNLLCHKYAQASSSSQQCLFSAASLRFLRMLLQRPFKDSTKRALDAQLQLFPQLQHLLKQQVALAPHVLR